MLPVGTANVGIGGCDCDSGRLIHCSKSELIRLRAFAFASAASNGALRFVAPLLRHFSCCGFAGVALVLHAETKIVDCTVHSCRDASLESATAVDLGADSCTTGSPASACHIDTTDSIASAVESSTASGGFAPSHATCGGAELSQCSVEVARHGSNASSVVEETDGDAGDFDAAFQASADAHAEILRLRSAARLGRSLSNLRSCIRPSAEDERAADDDEGRAASASPGRGAKAEPTVRFQLPPRFGESSSNLSGIPQSPEQDQNNNSDDEESEGLPEVGHRSSVVEDEERGYSSQLPRQDSLRPEVKKRCEIDALNAGQAGIPDGAYLFVVMVGDPNHIRLIHEDDLVAEGAVAGHSSLVERREFKRSWSRHWSAGRVDALRPTVLFAGELEYEDGVGVVSWNNHSGHYMPNSEDHLRVGLDPDTFVASD